jgi:hypothetical protein
MSRWIRPGDNDAWAALFTSFTTCAFRLEGQQVYSSEVENAALVRFLAGEPHGVDLSWTTSKLAVQRRTGRTQTLVRVVVEPPTDYTRMELTVYPEFVAAGQDTRIIPAPEGTWPDGLPTYDYWLFDNHDVWRMHYHEDHSWAGAQLLDGESTIADHLRWRDTALAQAIPLHDYLAARKD